LEAADPEEGLDQQPEALVRHPRVCELIQVIIDELNA